MKLRKKLNHLATFPTDHLFTFIITFFLVLFLAVILVPMIWMGISSLKVTNEIFSNIWSLPSSWQWNNYAVAWDTGISRYFINSAVVTLGTVLLNLVACSLMAYTLTINDIKGKNFFTALAIMGILFSPIVSIFPLYREIQLLQLYNKRLALVLIYTAYQIPMSFMLIFAFFKNIDKAYLDAARIDGATDLQILYKVFIPLSASIFMVSVVLTSFYAWNEFTFALVFVKNDLLKTIPIGLLAFQGEMYSEWGVLLAGLVISAIPIIALYIFAQKYFIAGLTMGGVKG
ncbi:carbohydrate ABC transporter permease [uncultured Sphaerochaeta sp.]|uniref:carbohydrate ABC transporter permease n=1 Tax=uncultured Sphaerochaeta sp. TaxID=886478 RepID=UPI002A0A65BE|nr:carbohydrate ABC transporter permease [uncultured Sphaerochaeta sp.]